MANPREKMPSVHEFPSPLEVNDEEIDPSFSCGCLWALCGRRIGARRYLLQQQEGEQAKESWLVEKVKKAREISEVLAGPKWKNFIRSFSTIYKKRRVQFQYDPQSYALNFDDGNVDREAEGAAAAYHHFSNSGSYVASQGMNAKF
ncbi:hypothetical protein FF2_016986 [Malus domestica]